MVINPEYKPWTYGVPPSRRRIIGLVGPIQKRHIILFRMGNSLVAFDQDANNLSHYGVKTYVSKFNDREFTWASLKDTTDLDLIRRTTNALIIKVN